MRSPVTVVAAKFEDLVAVGLRVLISEDENLRLVAADVPTAEIEAAFDLDHQLRHVDAIFDRVFRSVAAPA